MEKQEVLSELSEHFDYWQSLWADAARRNGTGMFVFTPDSYQKAVTGEELEPSIWSLEMFKTQVLSDPADIKQLDTLLTDLNMDEEFLVLVIQNGGEAEFIKMNKGNAGIVPQAEA